MEVAARELMLALTAAAPDVRFTAFVNREAAAEPGPWNEVMDAVTVPVNATNRIEWVRGEQQYLPRMASRAGVDVLHSLGSTAPAWGSFRRVVTVHDLIYRRYPEAHAGLRAQGMRILVPLAVRRSHTVIAVSHSTRNDLIELLRTPPGKVDVVPMGMGALRRAEALPEADTRERFELGRRRVLLSLSAKRPHKNLAVLLSALARRPAQGRPVLVLPGYKTAYEAELVSRARSLGVESDVRFPKWVSEPELEGLWQLADAFVYPSLYEGFGLPLLEAMARGVPVASSNASSLPEVAGGAALLFQPHDEAAIAAAIERLLDDAREAARLRAAGIAQAAKFTWERAARATLDVYRRSLE